MENGELDPDAVLHHRRTGPVMRQVVGFGDRSRERGTFGGKFGACHCNQWGLYGVYATVLRRGPLPKLLWANLSSKPMC